MKKLLLATGQPKMDTIIEEKLAEKLGYEVVGKVGFKKDLFKTTNQLEPDLVIVSKNLSGKDITVLEAMLRIRTELPNVRILYLAGELDENNREKVSELATLVMSGVYDIIHEKNISTKLLEELMTKPRDREHVQYLLKHIKANVVYENEIVELEEEEELEDIEEDGYKNVFLVSSIKPGTGKSFVSSNLATCLAKFGVKKADGKPPKVAIIEADLQNLSVGTILRIEDENKNLKKVMDKIATLFDRDGYLIDDELNIKTVNDFIKNSFQQYSYVKNLYALVGSKLAMEEVEDIKPIYYEYLIQQILDDYDVIIIDSNSSLAHTTTYPLLRMCNTAFYVIDLDFNNIRNNERYKKTLDNIEVSGKVKYVLNKDITRENRMLMNRDMIEDLLFTSEEIMNLGYNIVSCIPELPSEVFLNRLYTGTPVVLDDYDYTLKARIELTKVANEIWEIENTKWLDKEYEKYKEKTLSPRKKGFFNK